MESFLKFVLNEHTLSFRQDRIYKSFGSHHGSQQYRALRNIATDIIKTLDWILFIIRILLGAMIYLISGYYRIIRIDLLIIWFNIYQYYAIWEYVQINHNSVVQLKAFHQLLIRLLFGMGYTAIILLIPGGNRNVFRFSGRGGEERRACGLSTLGVYVGAHNDLTLSLGRPPRCGEQPQLEFQDGISTTMVDIENSAGMSSVSHGRRETRGKFEALGSSCWLRNNPELHLSNLPAYLVYVAIHASYHLLRKVSNSLSMAVNPEDESSFPLKTKQRSNPKAQDHNEVGQSVEAIPTGSAGIVENQLGVGQEHHQVIVEIHPEPSGSSSLITTV